MKDMSSLPSHIEAEQALLGALLIDNDLLVSISDFLEPIHFCDVIHGKIYGAILKFYERGVIADPITLRDFFERDQVLKEVGGHAYLVDLAQNVLLLRNVTDYARVICESYLRRELIHIGHQIIEKATNPCQEDTAETLISEGEKLLYTLATTGRNSEKNWIPFSVALAETIKMTESAFKRKSHVVGVTTGLKDIDHWLGGLHPSDLLILAGRPSMGKTALATNIAFNAAKANLQNDNDGAKVLFFSLEMSSEQLAGRILAAEVEIPSNDMRKGNIAHHQFDRFLKTASELEYLPLIIDDTPGLNIVALRNRARRIQRQNGLGLIVVDYLQLLEGNSKENRVQEISEITRALKGLAKELNVPVLALSQLSRAVEQREDKRPQLSDLRESGSIEQDADVVMFVYREEYYLERQQPQEGTLKHSEWVKSMTEAHNKAEVILAKQRHGPVGTIKVFFDGRFTRFGDLVRH